MRSPDLLYAFVVGPLLTIVVISKCCVALCSCRDRYTHVRRLFVQWWSNGAAYRKCSHILPS